VGGSQSRPWSEYIQRRTPRLAALASDDLYAAFLFAGQPVSTPRLIQLLGLAPDQLCRIRAQHVLRLQAILALLPGSIGNHNRAAQLCKLRRYLGVVLERPRRYAVGRPDDWLPVRTGGCRSLQLRDNG